MKPKMMPVAMVAATMLATPLASSSANASSAEATFDAFNSCCRTSQEVETEFTFLSRYRTIEDSDALSSFDSRNPTGFILTVR